MKKHLNTAEIASELSDSVFFPRKKDTSDERIPTTEQTSSASPEKIEEQKALSPTTQTNNQQKATTIPRYHDTMIPSNHDTMTPTNHDTVMPEQENSLEEAIRKAVKQVGKEAATYRFTEAEKEALADIEYSYKRQGIRTSGNEITRIGVNFLVEDYHRNGENSILAKILKLLNA